MALRDLVDGECGRANSLVHLSSHFLQDRSHKEDGLRHQTPYEDTFTNADADQLVQEFLSETLFRPPQTFRMGSLLQEMREMESAASQHAPIQAPGVAASLASNDPDWTQEFLESRKQIDEGHEENIWDSVQERPLNEPIEGSEFKEFLDNDFAVLQPDVVNGRPYGFPERRPLYMDMPRMNLWRQYFGTENEDPLANVAGLDTADEVEEVWDDAISDNLSDAKTVVLPSNEEASAVKGEETLPNKQSTLDDQGVFSSDLWVKLTESWQKLLNPNDPSWGSDLSDYNDPYKQYPFESENPMKDQPNALEEGKRRLEAGDLSGAVLCFEAAVQRDPENSEAWQLLGMSQAENEQDPQAIAALKSCLSLDPGNLKALMAIAISYTNENYPYHAFHHLKEWLRHNPRYSQLVPHEESSFPRIVPSFLTGDIHKEVQDLYITAARLHPKEDIDPDVQCGLGVLFNLSREYDKAVDCFKAALQVRQTDSRTWNRLGATLANGDRSEEAVDAYHRALALAPGYVRARYNVGITCLNLSAYREAIEHFLIALNQQAQAKGIDGTARSSMSDSIWGTLRLVMSLNNRQDLYEAVDNRDLAKLNEEYGIDLKKGSTIPSS
ncbi:peroxisomal targeting signal 1 receptor [Anabrus simplex]|uniref:peroxisomal targeting signal 1 receptor n=1 Tax=Anabrus simplex TaxID=316456 RepID=UPI0035A2FDB8